MIVADLTRFSIISFGDDVKHHLKFHDDANKPPIDLQGIKRAFDQVKVSCNYLHPWKEVTLLPPSLHPSVHRFVSRMT